MDPANKRNIIYETMNTTEMKSQTQEIVNRYYQYVSENNVNAILDLLDDNIDGISLSRSNFHGRVD